MKRKNVEKRIQLSQCQLLIYEKIPFLNDTRVTRATTRENVINMYYLSKSNYQTLSLTHFTLMCFCTSTCAGVISNCFIIITHFAQQHTVILWMY